MSWDTPDRPRTTLRHRELTNDVRSAAT